MVEKQEHLWSTISRCGISPNLMYLLYCIEAKKDIHKESETTKKMISSLYEKGFVIVNDVDINITSKGYETLETIEGICKAPTKNVLGEGYKENIAIYRELFPRKGIISGNKEIRHLRDNTHDLETNFKWFFKNFKYTWEDILDATRKYLVEQETNDYLYCKQSKYLIKKNNESTLATLIETYKNSLQTITEFKPVHTKLI